MSEILLYYQDTFRFFSISELRQPQERKWKLWQSKFHVKCQFNPLLSSDQGGLEHLPFPKCVLIDMYRAVPVRLLCSR